MFTQAHQRAIEDPDFLRGVLLEVQRLWPPFIGGRRLADQVGFICTFLIFLMCSISFLSYISEICGIFSCGIFSKVVCVYLDLHLKGAL